MHTHRASPEVRWRLAITPPDRLTCLCWAIAAEWVDRPQGGSVGLHPCPFGARNIRRVPTVSAVVRLSYCRSQAAMPRSTTTGANSGVTSGSPGKELEHLCAVSPHEPLSGIEPRPPGRPAGGLREVQGAADADVSGQRPARGSLPLSTLDLSALSVCQWAHGGG